MEVCRTRPVSRSRAVTKALETAAPDVSVTAPERVAETWEKVRVDSRHRKSADVSEGRTLEQNLRIIF